MEPDWLDITIATANDLSTFLLTAGKQSSPKLDVKIPDEKDV